MRMRFICPAATIAVAGLLGLGLSPSPGFGQSLTPQEAVELYGAAWGEPDPERRRELLERAWADDGVYTDPTAEVKGREALVAHIGGFLEQTDGGRIVLASRVDHHHGTRLRFRWEMRSADGKVLAEGMDYGRARRRRAARADRRFLRSFSAARVGLESLAESAFVVEALRSGRLGPRSREGSSNLVEGLR